MVIFFVSGGGQSCCSQQSRSVCREPERHLVWGGLFESSFIQTWHTLEHSTVKTNPPYLSNLCWKCLFASFLLCMAICPSVKLVLVIFSSYSVWISTCPSSTVSVTDMPSLCWVVYLGSPGAHSSLKCNRGHVQIIAFAKEPDFNTDWPVQDTAVQRPVRWIWKKHKKNSLHYHDHTAAFTWTEIWDIISDWIFLLLWSAFTLRQNRNSVSWP